jgi:hypothetical protein
MANFHSRYLLAMSLLSWAGFDVLDVDVDFAHSHSDDVVNCPRDLALQLPAHLVEIGTPRRDQVDIYRHHLAYDLNPHPLAHGVKAQESAYARYVGREADDTRNRNRRLLHDGHQDTGRNSHFAEVFFHAILS